MTQTSTITENSARYTIALVLVLACLLFVRVLSLWFNNSELFFDEAQYWFWSTDPDFGYFSKPPLLAWLIGLSTSLCGSDSPFCIRISSPFVHTGTAVFIYLTACRLFDQRTGFWAGVIYAMLPAVSLSSTLISTDVPLLFFWSAALYFYVRLLESPDRRWGIALGIAIGLGLNAKYAMAYFVACSLIHMMFAPQEYTPARKSPFWLGVGIALVFMIPNVIWNIQNGFVTVSHTGENIGWEDFDPNFVGVLEFLGSQFGVFGPIAFLVLLLAALGVWRKEQEPVHGLLLSFCLPILALMIFQAVMSKAYANWAATAYVAGTIFVADFLANRLESEWGRNSNIVHGLVLVLIAIGVTMAQPGQIKLPFGYDPFERTQGAEEIAALVEEAAENQDIDAILTANRKISALMTYYLRDFDIPVEAWKSNDVPVDHYQLVSPFSGEQDSTVLYVSKGPHQSILNAFENAELIVEKSMEYGQFQQIYIYRLSKFKR